MKVAHRENTKGLHAQDTGTRSILIYFLKDYYLKSFIA